MKICLSKVCSAVRSGTLASFRHIRDMISRFRNPLFWTAFAVLAAGIPWCSGAFLRAFDMPEFAAWGATAVLPALLVLSLFSRRFLLAAALLEIAVTAVFCRITPEQRFPGTKWQKPWRHTPEVKKLDGSRYELHHVRDFLYRSENDFDVRYRSMIIDPDRISSIDAAFSHWDNMEEIAHSMLGLNFADGSSIVISLETRLPEGAVQNAIDGIYRRYALAMLAGTPEDLYGLRADHRGETLYVYRLDMEHKTLRGIVISLLERAAELQRKPMFYNSLYRNCTTGLLPMLPGADQYFNGDFRLILNGMMAKTLFEKDLLVCRKGESFGSLRARSIVPGLCRGKNAESIRYGGESEARWLREYNIVRHHTNSANRSVRLRRKSEDTNLN